MQQTSCVSPATSESLVRLRLDAKVIGGICFDVKQKGEVTCVSWLHHRDFLQVFVVNKDVFIRVHIHQSCFCCVRVYNTSLVLKCFLYSICKKSVKQFLAYTVHLLVAFFLSVQMWCLSSQMERAAISKNIPYTRYLQWQI